MILNDENLSGEARTVLLRNQKVAWSLKRLLGLPTYAAPDNGLHVAAGGIADTAKGAQIAVLAGATGRDVLYLGFRTGRAKEVSQLGIGWRGSVAIEWREGLKLYAPSAPGPLVLLDTHRGCSFVRGARNSLVEQPGLPKDINRGHRVAMTRLRQAVAQMCCDELAPDLSFVPQEADPAEHLPRGRDYALVCDL